MTLDYFSFVRVYIATPFYLDLEPTFFSHECY